MDKTQLVEYFRGRRDHGLAMADIQADFGQVPERTLRRWLAGLVHEGVLSRSGTLKSTRYRLAAPPAMAATSRKASSVVATAPGVRLEFSPVNRKLLA
jgi:hypothetical protein